MDNLSIFNAVRSVPPEAQKMIQGGRLKGMTDINPVWRMQTLTEQFGPVGIGWKYEIVTPVSERFVPGANGEIAALIDVNLYIKVDDEWSEAIPGTGGSMFVANESSGLRTSDEAVKMALTDALSVCCKALGIGADVYWANGAANAKSNQKTSTQKAQAKNSKSENAKDTTVNDSLKPNSSLPNPKAEKEKAEYAKARALIAPSGPFQGKTLGEIGDTDKEELKPLAQEAKSKGDLSTAKACVVVYNTIDAMNKAAKQNAS